MKKSSRLFLLLLLFLLPILACGPLGGNAEETSTPEPTKKQPTKIIYTLRKKASAAKDGFYR